MKIKCTLMAMLMVCGVLAFNACDDDSDEDKKDQLLPLLLLSGKTYAIGEIGPSGVGIVFYITDGGRHGLEAAPHDQNLSLAWITGGSTQTTENGNTSTAIGTGLANSNAIIVQSGHTGSAAKVCRNYRGGGMTDWFLPSSYELHELCLQKDNLAAYAGYTYWSSHEYDLNTSHCINFDNCYMITGAAKSAAHRVRAVRAF